VNGLCYTTECEKIGVLSVGCVNNHVALLETHSIGSQYQDRLKDCCAKKSELALEIWIENDTAVLYSLKVDNP
jgi:hypothetical protein